MVSPNQSKKQSSRWSFIGNDAEVALMQKVNEGFRLEVVHPQQPANDQQPQPRVESQPNRLIMNIFHGRGQVLPSTKYAAIGGI